MIFLFIMKNFLLIFLLLFSQKSGFSQQVLQQKNISLHKLEWLSHKDEFILDSFPKIIKPFPYKPKIKPVVEIMGYLPYWNFGKAKLRFEYLTIISYFGMSLNSNGEITKKYHWQSENMTKLIEEAHKEGIKLIVTITLFDNSAIHTLLSSDEKRKEAINNIVKAVSEGGGDGVNIDFEFVPSEDKNNFVIFIKELKEKMNATILDSHVSIATPSVDWKGAYDYDELAKSSDGLMIMAYAYHYAGGEPGPISPLISEGKWKGYDVTWTVNDYLEYGGVENKKKFLLGLPFYGYDWPTLDEKVPGKSLGKAKYIPFYKAEIDGPIYGWIWDDDSQTPYYVYKTTQWHQVFCDDGKSLGLKMDLVSSKDLGGIGIWALGYDGESMTPWIEIEKRFFKPVDIVEEIEEVNNVEDVKEIVVEEYKPFFVEEVLKEEIYEIKEIKYENDLKEEKDIETTKKGGGGCGCSFSKKQDFHFENIIILIIILFVMLRKIFKNGVKKCHYVQE